MKLIPWFKKITKKEQSDGNETDFLSGENEKVVIDNNGVKHIFYGGKEEYTIYPLSLELKNKCVEHLREELGKEMLSHIKGCYDEYGEEEWLEKFAGPMAHFGWGMGIRNCLREVVRDDELPVCYYSGCPTQNFDDFYVYLLEVASGCKDINSIW